MQNTCKYMQNHHKYAVQKWKYWGMQNNVNLCKVNTHICNDMKIWVYKLWKIHVNNYKQNQHKYAQ